jgi:N-dimethylarginine dimethylaminohydrolase
MREIKDYFVKNSIGVLKKVLMCPPTFALSEKIVNGEKIKVNTETCIKEHNELVNAYRENGVEVSFMDPDTRFFDEVFSRDFGTCVKEGYILGNFKNKDRVGETKLYEEKMKELKVPCILKCTKGFFEGGDFFMLDENTLAIGMLERTDEAGVREITNGLKQYGYEVIGVSSMEKCIHLDMCFNIVDEKLAVACREVLPQSFLDVLNDRGFNIIDVDRKDIMSCFCNIQSLGRHRVMSFKNNSVVNKKLRSYGIEVIEIDLNEIFKHNGGIHCMTFPLKRE